MNEAFILIVLHFIADFVCQSDKMAINKSKSNYWLTVHVITYSFVLLILGGTLYNTYTGIWFNEAVGWYVIVNAILHWITDYFTSRLNSYLWKKEMRHWFFVGIGFDQVIHYGCLLYTYDLIILQ